MVSCHSLKSGWLGSIFSGRRSSSTVHSHVRQGWFIPSERVTNHGSTWRIEATSASGIAFAKESIQVEPWQGKPTDFVTDHRPARDIIYLLCKDGFSIRFAWPHNSQPTLKRRTPHEIQ